MPSAFASPSKRQRRHDFAIAHALIPQILAQRAALGTGAECRDRLREALRLYNEMGATGHGERLAKELAP
jgi:hypothetical protein